MSLDAARAAASLTGSISTPVLTPTCIHTKSGAAAKTVTSIGASQPAVHTMQPWCGVSCRKVRVRLNFTTSEMRRAKCTALR